MVGVVLALAVAAMMIGLDRARAFYPTVLIVVASYYSLFAVMGASGRILEIETAVGMVFSPLAVFGFRRKMWLVAAALAGHGIFDLFHHLLIENRVCRFGGPGSVPRSI